MHPLLQPILPTGITIVLWCVCSAATALVQPVKNNDPPPQHQPEPTAFITVVRTIPILKELAFEDCRPSHFGSNLTSIRSLPNAPIQSAAARAAATFILVEFCHGGAGDEQMPGSMGAPAP
jgi:hypothetical protein